MSLGVSNNGSLEDKLWDAIDIALKNLTSVDFMLVVNGLDGRCTAEVAAAFSRRLEKLAETHPYVKTIILARGASHFSKSSVRVEAITSDHTHYDIHLITRHSLTGCQHFLAHELKAQEEIIEKILRLANGDFLTARLIVKSLKQESSIDGFTKVLKSLKESSGLSEQLVKQVISKIVTDPSKGDGTLILSWLLIAKRPLTVEEISNLIQTHRKADVLTGKIDAASIKASCGRAVIVQSGIVRLAHTAFRDQLIKLFKDGKGLPRLPSLHASFLKLLLSYCKLHLTASIAPTCDLPEDSSSNSLFTQDSLLQYGTMNCK